MTNEDKVFLPDAVNSEPASPNPYKRRTVLLWVVLVIVFFAVWTLLGESPRDTAAPAPTDAASPLSVDLLCILLPAVFLVVLYLWLRRIAGDSKTFNESQTPGFLALAEGRPAEAMALLHATIGKFAKKSVHRCVAELNVGSAALRAGMFDEAIASFASAVKSAGPLLALDVRLLGAISLAQAYALVGDVSAAQRWADAARAWLARARGDRLAMAGLLCIAEALIALRSDQPAQALGLLEGNRLKLRHTLTSNNMRMVEVIAAFAVATAGPDAVANLHCDADIPGRLARVSPVLPDEFAHLGARWPEFQVFLREQGLSMPNTTPAP